MRPEADLIESILVSAVDIESAAERRQFVERACGGDPELRRRVEELVENHFHAGSFLEGPAVGPAETASFGTPAANTPTSPRESSAAQAEVVGPYKLVQEIGEGGMGTVFLAQQQEPVKRLVALKIIKAGMDSRAVLARFEAERQALAMMDHPNIAKVFDGGATSNGRPYFVMELVKGTPITKYCDDHRLSPKDRLELFVQVCQAVQHAHQKGVIHRDIKPSNVLVAPYDAKPVVKVIDFGVAKAAGQTLTEQTLVTGFGAIVGTLEYMSPEQAELNNTDIDTRSDIYALGVVLYELLTGTTPLESKQVKQSGMLEALRIIREEEPPKLSNRLASTEELPVIAANRGTEPRRLTRLVRGELDWIVMKCLEKDRNRRYETANGFAADVQRYLVDEPVQACPPSAGYRMRKFVRRNSGAVLAVAMVLLALVAGTAVSAWQAVRANRAEEKAGQDRDMAQEAEADTRAFSDFLISDVLAATRPKGEQGGLGRDVTVRVALDAAVPKLAERFRGRPRAEAVAREAIGNTYRMIGDYRNGEVQLRRAVELRRRALGPDQEDTLRSQHGLAKLLLANEQADEAESLLEETVRSRQVRLGSEHRDTLASLSLLGVAHARTGHLPESVRTLEKALKSQRTLLGPDDPDSLDTLDSLGNALRLSGRHREALPLMEELYRRAQRVWPPEHPDRIECLYHLGLAYRDGGRPADAVPILEQALRLNESQRGPNHTRTWDSLHSLARAYEAVGRVPEALAAFAEIVKRQTADPAHGPNSWFTIGAACTLALAQIRAGHAKDALPLLEDSVKRLPLSPNAYPDIPGILPALADLLQGYRDASRQPEADRVRALLCEAYAAIAEVLLRQPNHVRLAKAADGFPEMFPERGEGYVRAAGFLAQCVAPAQRDVKLPEENRHRLAREYGDRALLMLRKAINEGYSKPNELRNAPAFESLRSRDEFGRLIKELEAKVKR